MFLKQIKSNAIRAPTLLLIYSKQHLHYTIILLKGYCFLWLLNTSLYYTHLPHYIEKIYANSLCASYTFNLN